jgi:hypothetical protein
MASLQEKPRGEFLHETRGLQPAAYTRIPILKHVLKKEVCCGNCLHLNVSIICVYSAIAQTGAEDCKCELAIEPTKFLDLDICIYKKLVVFKREGVKQNRNALKSRRDCSIQSPKKLVALGIEPGSQDVRRGSNPLQF